MNAGEQPLLKVAYHVIFMINKLHLVWVPNFIAWGIYFLSGTTFSWNEENDTCFNVECVLHGRNFNFLGGYLPVTVRYLVVTVCYRLLLPVPTFSMNIHYVTIWEVYSFAWNYFSFLHGKNSTFFHSNFHSNISPKEMNSSHKCITLIFTLGKQLQLIHEQQMIQLALLYFPICSLLLPFEVSTTELPYSKQTNSGGRLSLWNISLFTSTSLRS